jgi:hypothetical protein
MSYPYFGSSQRDHELSTPVRILFLGNAQIQRLVLNFRSIGYDIIPGIELLAAFN